ncbi:MAG: peptide deformylase [Proteobacteria bacterium]|nr:peptide deformylase [Pseudomonadota bacterium]MCP4916369.1 peptide deformylase [Pseudomonadota bacterium]
MIIPILFEPNPLLHQKARPVREDEFGADLERRLRDMAETMYAAPGVGLAGPQVGDLRRLIVVDLTEDRDDEGRRKKGEALTLMVNPIFLSKSKEVFKWEEGCLSVPEFWEYFERPKYVKVQYRDPYGGTHELDLADYPGVILQHEMDHLEGITLLDRVSRLKKTRYLKKVKKFKQRLEEEEAAW